MAGLNGMTALVVSPLDHGLSPILAHLGLNVLTAQDGAEALRIAERTTVDFALADVLLPGMDGAALLDALSHLPTPVRPGCAITCIRGFPVPETHHPILARPYSTADAEQLLRRLLPENRPVSQDMHRRIEEMLLSVGIPDHPGREYLLRAIAMTAQDLRMSHNLSRRVWPSVAAQCGRTPAQVERAVRHCIDSAWRSGSVEAQYRLFGNTIDAQRGKPTIAQMLARSADILRLEESL